MNLFKKLFSKPLSTQLTITSSNGFHLRPVAQFVSLAKSFPCSISATYNGKTVDAQKVNALLSLSLEKEDTFTLTTQGKEAEKALDALQTLFNTLMQDDKEVVALKKESASYEGEQLEGDIISQGVAVASTYLYKTQEIQHDSKLNFNEAITQTLHALEAQSTDIALAQKALLSSLQEKNTSLETLEQHINKEIKTLQGTKLSAKIVDYQDILQQVKKALGLEVKTIFPSDTFILLANDLLPSEIAMLSSTKTQGVILKETSINSHTAILLRASGIPSLIANIDEIPQESKIILDGFAGVVVISPSQQDIQQATRLQEKTKVQKAHSASKRFEPALTSSGKQIKVLANVGDVQSAKLAKEEGAEGIGLLRSEFLFKSVKPTLEAQIDAFTDIFNTFDDITVRTLDVGGDKALPYIDIPSESNPFLGIRGVRLFKTHPQILAEQLHAIFLASNGKKIKIMFPMVSSVEEFSKAKTFAQSVAKKHNIDISNIEFGIMVEVPSTLFQLEAFNEVVDFYSIGTNDLTQYLFAIERTHPTLKVDELSPVVFSAIETVVKQATKPVSICGELAANSDAIENLINLGLTTLSVSPKSIAQSKETIRRI